MKLAFICTEKLPSPAIRGGAVQMMLDGVLPFLSKKFELTVFSISDPLLPATEVRNQVHYIRLPRLNYAEHVSNALSIRNFDLIHVFNRPIHVLSYQKAAPQSRIVLSLHNEMFQTRKIGDEQGRQVIEALSAIMTVSRYIKNTVITRFPDAAAKTAPVYSGIDEQRYRTARTPDGAAIRQKWRERYQLGERPVILFAGRLSVKKGPHLLIKAMKQVIDFHPDAVLVIAGGKWFSDNSRNRYVDYLHRIAEPLGDHVRFINYIPADQIPELFLLADLFVCSSQWQEPLARVHYEAMAAGIPVITTNRGGNSEVVKHMENGWLITNYDQPAAFFEAIDFLLANPETAKTFAENGRCFVLDKHKFSDVAAHMSRVYDFALRG